MKTLQNPYATLSKCFNKKEVFFWIEVFTSDRMWKINTSKNDLKKKDRKELITLLSGYMENFVLKTVVNKSEGVGREILNDWFQSVRPYFAQLAEIWVDEWVYSTTQLNRLDAKLHSQDASELV